MKAAKKKFDYFIEDKGLELSISTLRNKSQVFYRNQLVSKAHFSSDFLSFQINILSGDAKTILTLNRDAIQTEYDKTLQQNVKNAALEVLSDNYNNLDEEAKKHASMYIELNTNEEQRKNMFGSVSLDDWKRLVVGKQPSKSLEDILAYDSIIFKKDAYYSGEIQLMQSNDKTLEIIDDPHNSELLAFITYKFGNQKLRYYTEESEKETVVYIELSKGNNEVIIDDWEIWFKQYWSLSHYSRNLMPCIDTYKALQIKENAVIWGCRDFTFEMVNQYYPKMVCPYIRISKDGNMDRTNKLCESVSERLYQFVYDNRFNESVTMEQIKGAYQKFINDTRPYVQKLL